ncbi:HK97 family phage prohead protease [Arthrobacter sp. NA-172]|uniref:HK97 family phage prohead protease n=1 Tax=Arthrobacter sp. NA-172 TaxID=3367524 RepID=UPI0037551E19
MNVTRKDARITKAPSLEDGPGTFEAILSAPTKDRDGDTLQPDEWKMPLPERITVDVDHEMSVKGTIGSARPWIDDDGNLRISGTFASTPLGQEVRTLMAEGHIDRTSVAFMSDPATQKDGRTVRMRELLNAAVVAIPSNREAAILEVRGLKAGARNSSADTEKIQSIHDASAALGADCSAAKSLRRKDADTEDASDPIALIQATDAAIDQAIDLLSGVDPTSLPAEVAQAIALIQAADAVVDELMDALGIPDPDEDDAASGADPAPAPGAVKSAPGSGAGNAPVVEVTSEEVLTKAANFMADLIISNPLKED